MTTTPTTPQPRPSGVPQLIITRDNKFWFDAAEQGRLLIQRCTECGTLRHPPGPTCPACRSFGWDTIEASLHGTLHSYTVVHHPQDSAFDYPLAIGLLDLPEGTRLVADIAGISPAELEIGMELDIVFTPHVRGAVLPQFVRGGTSGERG